MLTPRFTRLLILSAGIALLFGCERPPDLLETIRSDGKLIVVTRNAPTTYYEGRDGPEGYEYSLASALAESLDVEVEFRVRDSVNGVLSAVENGEAHLAAAGITRTESRNGRFRFGPGYFPVQQEVVCRRGEPLPKSPLELTEKTLRVAAGTSYLEQLTALQQQHPKLAWEADPGQGSEQLLYKVWKREIDCTVADSNIVAINRRYLPELLVAFPISEQQQLAWVLPENAESFAAYLHEWFREAEETGLMGRLYERYYGYAEIFDYVDMRVFMRRIESRLPRYEAMFREAAEHHQLPWTLLAAQAYQESHWNPRARSPTGVRGMMMLTLNTAKEVGVKSRLDPVQSIRGGAQYLSRMMKRLPESIQGKDRLWFALAAYNVGFAHLRDARTLAERLGRNPDRWVDLKEVLPLLAEKEHYRDLPYGYARGWEPVDYVQRIRDYRNVFERQLLLKSVTAEAVESDQPESNQPGNP
ncbi:membrane-bound lytic murein transglycosylase MltF [Thiohalomonas denitrificans]|uniref:Membrane-bound lytic murein transglycosylase F n=1 Tax=Thiohalomonas denitrificans TaxID=415747 RepID=A0A1G5QTT0_9GAMM|nr:membrane-bound lytic murein transglycosylase MltF [Thiohalomonas denitrificans]SCZ64988.1 membrane-bound lytic murein transglycosylase F [Thiohalomonas denitrificans]